MQSQTALFNSHVDPACQRKMSIFDTYIKVHLVNIVWQQHHLASLMPGWNSCLMPEETEIQRARWMLNYVWPLLCEQLFTAPAQRHPPPPPPNHPDTSPHLHSRAPNGELHLWLRRCRPSDFAEAFKPNLSPRLSSALCSCSWNETCKYAPASLPS